MRRGWWVLLLGAVLGLLIATPAQALSCVVPAYILPDLAVVAEGRLLEIKSGGKIYLDVHRYYKGSGGAMIEAEVFGLGTGHRMDWMAIPKVGDRLLIGFKMDGGQLRNDACHPLKILEPNGPLPAEWAEILGPGRSPEGARGANPGQSPPASPVQAPPVNPTQEATPMAAASAPADRRISPWWLVLGGLLMASLAGWWALRRWRH